MVDTNSVGLNSGFFAALTALTLSSYFLEMVDLIVFEAGISMASGAARLLWLILSGVVVPGDGGCVEVEEDELLEELELEELEETEQVSLSESECLSVWGGMLPVGVSVRVWSVSVFVCNVSDCMSVCLWINSLSFILLMSKSATRGSPPTTPSVADCRQSGASLLLFFEDGRLGVFGLVSVRFGATGVQIVCLTVRGTLMLPFGLRVGIVGLWVRLILSIIDPM